MFGHFGVSFGRQGVEAIDTGFALYWHRRKGTEGVVRALALAKKERRPPKARDGE